MMKRNDDYQGLINALERRVRELEAQVCNLAIQVAALAARGVPTYPGVLYSAPIPVLPSTPVRWYEVTCQGTTGLKTPTAPDFTAPGDLSYGGTS